MRLIAWVIKPNFVFKTHPILGCHIICIAIFLKEPNCLSAEIKTHISSPVLAFLFCLFSF